MKQLISKFSELHKFEVSCLSSKSWPILKTQKILNSQDVKDSEQFKMSLVSACFGAIWGPAKFQFSTVLKLIFLLVLSSLDQIHPNLAWMRLLIVENIWYGRNKFCEICFQTIVYYIHSFLIQPEHTCSYFEKHIKTITKWQSFCTYKIVTRLVPVICRSQGKMC